MFDTMTLTKVVGGLCGTFLVFLLGGWAAEALYVGGEGHAEGEEHQAAYVIEVPESGSAEPAAEEEAVPFDVAFAEADAAAGESVFRNCRSCHALAEGQNGVGPTLHGVVGRGVDVVPGYAYSGALEEVVDVWSEENLYLFLEDPQGFAPGTKMSYQGLSDAADRANLIAYLATNPG